MAELRIEQYQVGAIMTNCYFLINDDTKEVLIVDPGGHAGQLASRIDQGGLKPVAILLTHAHYDHADGVEELRNRYEIPVYAHENEKETLADPNINLSTMFGAPKSYYADEFAHDGQILDLAGFKIKVLYTPGHTTGGCCYYLEEQNTLASGDTLFCGSIGRTDFPGGTLGTLINGIKDKLLALPDDTAVLPGHESRTTIGYERKYNGFL